jgi:hypothetical protein
MLTILEHYRWQRIAIVCANELYSQGGSDSLAALLQEAGIEIVPLQPFIAGGSVAAALPFAQQLKRDNVKVIVL